MTGLRYLAVLSVFLCAARTRAEPVVLVLCNEREPASVDLARHYALVRQVPESQILVLSCPESEAVERSTFEQTLRGPVSERLQALRGNADEAMRAVVVLVLMRGVPLRVEGTLGSFGQRSLEQHRENDAASVDSELAALAVPTPADPRGSLANPAFNSQWPPTVIVGRLDGADWETARRLADDAVAVEEAGRPRGRALIDHAQMASQGEEYARGDAWLTALEDRFNGAGFPVSGDRKPGLLTADAGAAASVLLYAGWYAPHVGGLLKQEDFRFQRGAVAFHIHSLSAQTVRAVSQRWAGPLLARGAAVVLGSVDEPFLSHSTHPDLFFGRLLAGDSAGEAMWKATPRLSWMNVMIGDPLYRPFGKARK